jgi:hypothetical protein
MPYREKKEVQASKHGSASKQLSQITSFDAASRQ